MALIPKRTKYRRPHRLRYDGVAKGNTELHFGEYGFEMEEYTNANIDNKTQECIDYRTSEKNDTSFRCRNRL